MYGHYPLPIVAEPDTRPWQGFGGVAKVVGGAYAGHQAPLLQVLSGHNVSAYLCGHLHGAFGPRLHRLHAAPDGGAGHCQLLNWQLHSVNCMALPEHGESPLRLQKYVSTNF